MIIAMTMAADSSGNIDHEIARLDYAAYSEELSTRTKIQEGLAHTGFRTLVMMNGGAIIALFTLIGALGSTATMAMDTTRLWLAFGSFVGGLTFTMLGIFAGFFMQFHYALAVQSQIWNAQAVIAERAQAHAVLPSHERGNRWLLVAVACTVLGLIGFIAGAAFALAGVIPQT